MNIVCDIFNLNFRVFPPVLTQRSSFSQIGDGSEIYGGIVQSAMLKLKEATQAGLRCACLTVRDRIPFKFLLSVGVPSHHPPFLDSDGDTLQFTENCTQRMLKVVRKLPTCRAGRKGSSQVERIWVKKFHSLLSAVRKTSFNGPNNLERVQPCTILIFQLLFQAANEWTE